MISVKIRKNRNKEYLGFSCNGHAEYAEYGSDIVCAAVSMLIINTINSIDTLTNCTIEAKEDAESGYLKADFPNKASKEASLLIDAMILGIKGVIDQYGKTYVTLEIKEV
ncbi:MAG TPA: ribosomal-processing cysteine protease Prp [Lachnospiraceae bacterium]|nr:ribosomal-processing cysteine protease Prp [Lachnospiraceae bacterium]